MNRRRPHFRKGRVFEKIDYKKLALEIVEAQEASSVQIVNDDRPKLKFIEAVWYTITGKQKTNGKMTVGLFSLLLSMVLSIGALCITIALTILLIAFSYNIANKEWNFLIKLILWIVGIASYAGFLFLPLLMRGVANEMDVEADKYYITAVFSAFTSLAALIVATLALFK